MAERDRVRRALGRQDARQPRHLADAALAAAGRRAPAASPPARSGCARARPLRARSPACRRRRPCARSGGVEVREARRGARERGRSVGAVALEEVAEQERRRALARLPRSSRLGLEHDQRVRARVRDHVAPSPASGSARATRRPPSKRHARGKVRLAARAVAHGVEQLDLDAAAARRTRAPCMRSSAARTKTSKVTWAETGLPGRPKTSLSPRRPNTSGAPGLIATLVNSEPDVEAREHLLHQVVGAFGDAARDHEHVRARSPRARPRRCGPSSSGTTPSDARVGAGPARPAPARA